MCERWLTAWRWGAPPTHEVGCVTVMREVMGCVIVMREVMVYPSVLSRLSCNSGIVCGLPVVSQNWGMSVFEQKDGVVVGLSCSGLASCPLSMLNAHFCFSCHSPAADIIKGALLETLPLVDVFRVVDEAICAPPPLSLGSPLKT